MSNVLWKELLKSGVYLFILYVYICVCMCVEARDQPQIALFRNRPHYFLRQSLPLGPGPSDMAKTGRWASSRTFPVSACPPCQAFYVGSVVQLRSSCLCNELFTNGAISPALWKGLFFLLYFMVASFVWNTLPFMLALISIVNVFNFMSSVENWHSCMVLSGKLRHQLSLKQRENCLQRWEHLPVGR